MALNSRGPSKKYKYTMDDGTIIKLRLDATYGDLAECGLEPLTTGDNAGNKPTNFNPRVVYWQSSPFTLDADGNELEQQVVRREFVCNSDSDAFTSVDQFSITVDGIAGQTTGRKGEQISF